MSSYAFLFFLEINKKHCPVFLQEETGVSGGNWSIGMKPVVFRCLTVEEFISQVTE
jgi:hypothetical protein